MRLRFPRGLVLTSDMRRSRVNQAGVIRNGAKEDDKGLVRGRKMALGDGLHDGAARSNVNC